MLFRITPVHLAQNLAERTSTIDREPLTVFDSSGLKAVFFCKGPTIGNLLRTPGRDKRAYFSFFPDWLFEEATD